MCLNWAVNVLSLLCMFSVASCSCCIHVINRKNLLPFLRDVDNRYIIHRYVETLLANINKVEILSFV
jgi:hypothetical protein